MARRSRWKLVFMVGTAAVMALGGPAAAAKEPFRSAKACSLVTLGELESSLGVTGATSLVGMEIPFTRDASHDHDGSLFTCQGKIGGRFVLVMFGGQPVTPEGRRRAEEKITNSQEELRKKGYTIRTDDLGGMRCWTMAAPPGDTSAAAMFSATCGGTKGADFYSITVSAPGANDLVPIEKLRALAGRAASRLP